MLEAAEPQSMAKQNILLGQKKNIVGENCERKWQMELQWKWANENSFASHLMRHAVASRFFLYG